MSESMQTPSSSRRIWLAFAVSRGKGWAGAKAKPVSTHRWRAGEHGHGKWRVPARLGRGGTKGEKAKKGSVGIGEITLGRKNFGWAGELFTEIPGFDGTRSGRAVGRESP